MALRIDIIRTRTVDRTYTSEKIGKNQSVTPEGYLLCEGVPIARTGQLIYGPDETPVEVGKDGIAKIERDAEALFHPDTLSSFEGKPVTNDHPDESLGPENFKEHVVGIVQNVRRGEGIDDDLMLADLLIHDKDAIEAVRDGKREVSNGYDADYEQIEAGRGRQLNIMGNHVALVENGRCGSRCAIQDRSLDMKKKSVMDALLRAFKAKDAAEIEKIAKDMETGEEEAREGSTHVHVHLNGEKKEAKAEEGKVGAEDDGAEAEKAEGGSVEERLARIEALLEKLFSSDDEEAGEEGNEGAENMDEEEAPRADNKEDNKKDDDEKATKDARARLEILVPGMKLPVRDTKADPKKFRDSICAAKRRALDTAFAGDHREVLKPLLAGIDLKKAGRSTIDALFISGSEMVKVKNNDAQTRGGASTRDNGKAMSIADINKKARDVWASRGVN